jgi:hypothetical protein
VVKWATEALDEVRRQAWNDARRSGQTRGKGYGNRVATGDARRFKGARYALWKNPDHLTDRQRDKLAWIAKTDPRLYRAYLLKEGLRYVFMVKGEAGKIALDRWLSWARRCRIRAFVHLAKRITAIRDKIHANLDHGLSNACPSHCTSWRCSGGGPGDGVSVAGRSDNFGSGAAPVGRLLAGVVDACAAAVDAPPGDQPLAAPVADHWHGDVELFGHLVRGEHAGRAQPFLQCRDVVVAA